MAYVIPIVKNLESLRNQLNTLFANIFGTANAFTAAQTFPTAGIVIGAAKLLTGSGSPEGAVTAPVGSLFLRTDGSTSTTLYVKTAGATSTGWTAK